MKKVWVLTVMALLLSSSTAALAKAGAELQAQIEALQQRITELEEQQNDQKFRQRNGELIRQMVAEASAGYQAAADSSMTAGYDRGFFIKTTDDQFKLSINTRLQLRHYYGRTDDGDSDLAKDGTSAAGGSGVDASSSGFELERARIYFKGHVMKDLDYLIVLSMSDDDTSGSSDKGNTARLLDYALSYSFSSDFGLKAGRFKGPFGRSETTSSGRQAMVDRSLANEVFNIGRVQGIEAFGQIPMGDGTGYYRAGIFNGLATDAHEPIEENDNSPSLAARLAIPLAGASPQDFKNESDLKFHDNPVSQLGFSAAWTDDRDEAHYADGESDSYEFLAKSSVDGKSDLYTLGGEMILTGIDYSFKHQGFSLNLEGFVQCIDINKSEIDDASDFGNAIRMGTDQNQLTNYGWSAQSGIFLTPKEFELVGRISAVHVEDATDSYEYAGGWNWYLSGQDLKLSMDVSYIDDLPKIASSPGYDGVQNNSLFLVRTQLQFQF
jgi:hypothetical protein